LAIARRAWAGEPMARPPAPVGRALVALRRTPFPLVGSPSPPGAVRARPVTPASANAPRLLLPATPMPPATVPLTAMLIPGLSLVSTQLDNTPRLEKLVAETVGPPRVPTSTPIPATLPATSAVPVNFWTLRLGSAVL